MKWIIRYIPDGMFVISKRQMIHKKFFARRFNTGKQTEAYMTSSGFDRKKYTSEELKIETEKSNRAILKKRNDYFENWIFNDRLS